MGVHPGDGGDGRPEGEVCGIRWSDIDWESGSIRLDESVVAAPGGGIVKQPKSKASVRSVAVDVGTVEVLRSLRQDTERLAAACEAELSGDGFVFSVEPDGLAVPHPDAFSGNFRKLCDKAGVASDIHVHSLRHFQIGVRKGQVFTRVPRRPRAGERCIFGSCRRSTGPWLGGLLGIQDAGLRPIETAKRV